MFEICGGSELRFGARKGIGAVDHGPDSKRELGPFNLLDTSASRCHAFHTELQTLDKGTLLMLDLTTKYDISQFSQSQCASC